MPWHGLGFLKKCFSPQIPSRFLEILRYNLDTGSIKLIVQYHEDRVSGLFYKWIYQVDSWHRRFLIEYSIQKKPTKTTEQKATASVRILSETYTPDTLLTVLQYQINPVIGWTTR